MLFKLVIETKDKKKQSHTEPSGTSSQELIEKVAPKPGANIYWLAASVTDTWTKLLHFLFGCIIAVIEKQCEPFESMTLLWPQTESLDSTSA